MQKRDLTLVDKSQYSVRLTLWGKQAETFAADDLPVIAFKGVKVSDFGGKYESVAIRLSPYIIKDDRFR